MIESPGCLPRQLSIAAVKCSAILLHLLTVDNIAQSLQEYTVTTQTLRNTHIYGLNLRYTGLYLSHPSANMSAPHATLSAATDDRKARLAKLKSLKRKQPEDEIAPPESDRHVSPAPPAPATASQAEEEEQQQQLEKETARIQLSGRNYDPETRGPKLGFEAPPTLGPDEQTLEEQAAELEAEIRRKAAEEAKEDKGIDLFKLQPKKPNWDLKRELNKKLEVLNVRTDNAIARLVRERLQEKKVETQKKDGNMADGEAVAAGLEGGELEEIVRLREREEEDEERREREAIDTE